MSAWWNSLPLLQQILYIVAIPSTLILLIQTILTLIGLGHDGGDIDGAQLEHGDLDHGDLDHGGLDHADLDHADFDHGHCIDHDAGQHETSHDSGLHLLTLRGIVAFFTVFGWVGIALLDMGVPALFSIPLAVVAGAIALFLVAILLHLLTDLQQSGNLDLSNAIGLTGEVYVPITPEMKGKVNVILQERLTELDAICLDHSLKTGQRVRITGVTGDDVVVVVPLE